MRPEKELLLNEIKEKIDDSAALIVTSYKKLEPNAAWQLRSRLSAQGSLLEVVRKRVFVKAAEKAGISLDADHLAGNIGVVFVKEADAVPAAKTVFKFSEENENVLAVLFGRVEGKIVPGSDLEMLSKLPGIDEMRSTLLALFTSPMSQMLSVMEAAMAGPLSISEKTSES